MAYRTFIVPRHIYSGPGSIESLGTVSGKRAFIVTDSVIQKLGIVEQVENILHTNCSMISAAKPRQWGKTSALSEASDRFELAEGNDVVAILQIGQRKGSEVTAIPPMR